MATDRRSRPGGEWQDPAAGCSAAGNQRRVRSRHRFAATGASSGSRHHHEPAAAVRVLRRQERCPSPAWRAPAAVAHPHEPLQPGGRRDVEQPAQAQRPAAGALRRVSSTGDGARRTTCGDGSPRPSKWSASSQGSICPKDDPITEAGGQGRHCGPSSTRSRSSARWTGRTSRRRVRRPAYAGATRFHEPAYLAFDELAACGAGERLADDVPSGRHLVVRQAFAGTTRPDPQR